MPTPTVAQSKLTQRQSELVERYGNDGRWTDVASLEKYMADTPFTRDESTFYHELLDAMRLNESTGTMPVVTLKSVKYAAFASQETACFQATVYVDGVRFCKADNDGHGGSDYYSPIGKTQKQNELYVEVRALNERIQRAGGFLLEGEVGKALNLHLSTQDLKRMLRAKIVFVDEGKVWTVKRVAHAAKDVARVSAKYPTATILNTLPMDEALSLYMQPSQAS